LVYRMWDRLGRCCRAFPSRRPWSRPRSRPRAMKPALCAGIVVQLSISRKRAMKSCYPAEAPCRRESAAAFDELASRKWQQVCICTLIAPFKTLSH
jgi:hypothetical protein